MPPDNPLIIDFEDGEATLIADLDVLDYTKVPNARALGAAVPANVTYELRWSGPISRDLTVQDTTNGFAGTFQENQATLTWSASQPGFTFVSDPANTSTSLLAQLGRERNGIFF